jgi:hypothetical protein
MNDRVLQAFLRTRNGYSPDAVIADPALNARFLAACRELGAGETDFELNHCLYNLRKSRRLEGHHTTTRVNLRHKDEYEFAAEIAARFLERRQDSTLDRIICDPALAQEFDRIAEELAPGFTPFEYRFTALNLRKSRRLRPEIGPQLLPATQVESFPVAGLDINRIPRSQGIYFFCYRGEGLLYLGEARNLRDRIRKHLDHSDRKELARWLWEHDADGLYVEIHVLPDETPNAARKAVELDLIRSRRPRFNILGAEEGG